MEDLIKLVELKSVLICSFVAWGAVESVKPIIKKFLDKSYSSAALRALAIFSGCGIGFGLDQTAEGAGLGAACGAMSAFTVALVKKMISSKANVDMGEADDEPNKDDVEEGS